MDEITKVCSFLVLPFQFPCLLIYSFCCFCIFLGSKREQRNIEEGKKIFFLCLIDAFVVVSWLTLAGYALFYSRLHMSALYGYVLQMSLCKIVCTFAFLDWGREQGEMKYNPQQMSYEPLAPISTAFCCCFLNQTGDPLWSLKDKLCHCTYNKNIYTQENRPKGDTLK